MIAFILGALDIATALLFTLHQHYGFFPVGLVCGFSIYLIIKGGLFSLTLDIASIIDLICGIIIFASVSGGFALPTMLVTIIGFYLILKGAMSCLFFL